MWALDLARGSRPQKLTVSCPRSLCSPPPGPMLMHVVPHTQWVLYQHSHKPRLSPGPQALRGWSPVNHLQGLGHLESRLGLWTLSFSNEKNV